MLLMVMVMVMFLGKKERRKVFKEWKVEEELEGWSFFKLRGFSFLVSSILVNCVDFFLVFSRLF